MVTVITHAARISIPLAELVDMEKEKARMEKELTRTAPNWTSWRPS